MKLKLFIKHNENLCNSLQHNFNYFIRTKVIGLVLFTWVVYLGVFGAKMNHHQTRSLRMTSIFVHDNRLAGSVPPGRIVCTWMAYFQGRAIHVNIIYIYISTIQPFIKNFSIFFYLLYVNQIRNANGLKFVRRFLFLELISFALIKWPL